jgi:hypothetical protein
MSTIFCWNRRDPVITTDEQRDLILETTTRTLRQMGFIDDQLYETADAVERADAESLTWCCPLCEGVSCDKGCPLEPVRTDG